MSRSLRPIVLLPVILMVATSSSEVPVMAGNTCSLYQFESDDEISTIAQANEGTLTPQASDRNVREGERSLHFTLGPEGDEGGRRIRLPNPDGQDWSGAAALCFDVFNPYDEIFALDIDILDGESQGYHRGYWDQRWHLTPGWTEFAIDLRSGFRRGEHKESPLNLRDMQSIQLAIRPMLADEREFHIDNVRLEASADAAAALRANQQAVADFTTQRLAMPERKEAEAAAASLAAKIESARLQGVDTIYSEATLFVARLGLDLRAKLSWFSGIDEQRSIYDFVTEACGRAEDEIDGIVAGRRRPRTLVRRSPEELELRGAYWYAGDEPVLVTAMLYNSSGPLMRFFHPDDVVPCLLTTAGASRYDVERTPLYEAFTKYPETHRVGYDGWCGHLIRDRWSMGGGNEEVVICLESPHMKEAMAKAIAAKTPRPEDRPNMLVHVMEGELSYCCYCEHTQEMFRTWLLERHGDIAVVNSVWGTDYETIKDVHTPHHEDWDGNRARWYDFVDFNQWRFTQHHVWAKSIVRKTDPVTPVTVGGVYYTFSPRQGLLGVDTEAWIETMCEAAEAEAFGPSTMPTDFLWAVCDGDKPIIDLEYHSDIFSWWGNFLHGYAILAMWWWPGPETGDMLDTSVPHSPNIRLEEVEKLLVNALDIQRLGEYIIPFPKARSPFALLYGKSSLLQALPNSPRRSPYTRDLERLYDAALPLDAGRTFITEPDLTQGQAGRFRVIALPSVKYLALESFSRLLGFVQEGGTLLVTGDSLRADQYARPADYLENLGLSVSGSLDEEGAGDDSPERQPFGPGEPGWRPDMDVEAYHFAPGDSSRLVGRAPRLHVEAAGEAEVLARFEDGAPGLLRLSRGRGCIYYLGARLGEKSILSLVERLLDEAGVTPIVSVVEAGGERPRDIEARSVEHGDDVLLYVINPRNEELTLQLRTARSFGQIEDLRTLERRAYDGEIRVPPRDTGLFRFVEAP